MPCIASSIQNRSMIESYRIVRAFAIESLFVKLIQNLIQNDARSNDDHDMIES